MSSPIDSLTYQAPAHAFNPLHAAAYGIEEAILIAHFQHWINHNMRLGYNRRDERTWTYQTRKQIAANFPYLTEKQVRTTTDSLEAQGVIMKGNFNKIGIDKTIWYAFCIEEMFTIAQMGTSIAQTGKWTAQMGTPIPDTKPNTKHTKKEHTSPAAAASCRLSDFLLMKIKEMDPTFKQPNLKAWVKVFSLMMDEQGRSENDIKAVITWVFNNDFWCTNILSPSKLEKQYTALFISMTKDKENPKAKQAEETTTKLKRIEENKASATKFLLGKRFPDYRNSMKMRDQGVDCQSNGASEMIGYAIDTELFRKNLQHAYIKNQQVARRTSS